MKRLNKKAFTLVEILVAVAILAVAVIGIGSVIISTQNNTTKRLTEADLQQQVTEIKENLHNELLSANIGVNCWIKEGDVYKMNGDGKISDEQDRASKEKVIALYNVDRTDFIFETTYYKWNKDEKTLSVAKTTKPIRENGRIPSNDQTIQIEENIDKILDECEWSLISQNIDYFNVRLENPDASEKLISVDLNVSSGKSVYPVNDTVYVRNEIKTNANEFTVDKYTTITLKVPSIPDNSPSVFTYDGETHTPKIVDYYENYMTIVEGSTLSASTSGDYYVRFELKDKKNYQWPDGTTTDKTIFWSIGKRTVYIEYGLNTWVYDGQTHTIDYTITGYDRIEEMQITFTNRTIGPNVCSKICTATIGSNNFEFGNDPSTPISITPKTAEADIELHPTMWDGTVKTIATVSRVEGGTVKFYTNINGVTPSKNEVTQSVCQETNANTYYVFYVVLKDNSGNYIDSDVICAGQVDIQRAPTAYAETIDFVYNGSERNTTTSTRNNGVKWSGVQKATNAGSYTAYVEPDSNHCWPDGSLTKKQMDWMIDKAPGSVTAPTANNLTFTGSAQKLFKTDPTTPYGTIKYKVGTGNVQDTSPTRTDAGTYRVYYWSTGNSNYYGTSESAYLDVKIKKASSDNRFNRHPANANPTYVDQQKVTIVTDGTLKDSNADIMYRLKKSDGTWGDWSSSLPQALNAGKYNVQYYIDQPESSNYADSKYFDLNCTVQKRANASLTVDNKTYNGSAQAGYKKVGVSILSTQPNGYTKTATSVGTYKTKGQPDSNHTWPDGKTDVREVSWKITKRKNEIQTSPTFANDIPYDGKSHALVTNVGSSKYGPKTIEFSTDGKKTWFTTKPSKTKYGKYTIYYRAKGDTNHDPGDVQSKTVEIYLVTAQVTTKPTAKTLTYNGSNQKLLNAGAADGGTMKYKLGDGSWSTTVPSAKNAGTYTVYWKVDGTGDIQGVAQSPIQVKIDRAKTAKTGSASGWTYNGKEYAGVTAGDYCSRSSNYKQTNAGTYTVTYTADSNHLFSNGKETATVSFTVKRAKTATADWNGGTTRYSYNTKGDRYTSITNPMRLFTYTGSTITAVSTKYCVDVSGSATRKSYHDTNTEDACYTTYKVKPDDNHAWSDGSTSTKTFHYRVVKVMKARGDSVNYNTPYYNNSLGGGGSGDKAGPHTLDAIYYINHYCYHLKDRGWISPEQIK